MKFMFYFLAKALLIIVISLIILSTAAFAFFKWLANDEIKVAVGKKFPLLMMIDNQPVDEKSYILQGENNPSIYHQESKNRIYPLIRFAQDPVMLDKLCLIDFTGDKIYRSFELQHARQDNSDHYILIMYRQDGAADFYYSRGLNIDRNNIKSLLNEVYFFETSFKKVNFFVTEKGLNVSVSLLDKHNRNINFSVKENNKKINNYRIIAPVGDTSRNPKYFPVILLDNFDMVQKKGTTISVKIDDSTMKPQELFPLYNYEKVYLSRYSGQVIEKQLTPDYSGEVKPIEILNGATKVTHDDNTYSISDNNGHKEIRQITSRYGNIEVGIKFSPALPDLVAIKNNTKIEGHFSISVGKANGMLGGTYKIIRQNNSVKFQLSPQIGWQPMPGDLWMKTYLWNCDIEIDNNNLKVNSNWSRI